MVSPFFLDYESSFWNSNESVTGFAGMRMGLEFGRLFDFIGTLVVIESRVLFLV